MHEFHNDRGWTSEWTYYSMFFVQVSDYHYIPDTPKMSDRLRVCLQENDEVKF